MLRLKPNAKGVAGALRQCGRALSSRRAGIGKFAVVALLAVVCALPAVVDNSVIGYLPILALVFSLICMAIYLQLLDRGVELDAKGASCTCQRGDEVDVVLGVQNAGYLLASRIEASLYISNLEGGVDVEVFERFALLPKENRELELSARFDHVGCYAVGIRSIVLFDLFALFKKTRKLKGISEVVVEPRLIELSGLPIAQEQACDNNRFKNSVVNDGYDYVGLRDYELGDPMKSVHWKASARFESLFTRVRESQINPGVCIVVDRYTSWPRGEEHMCCYDAVVESALALMHHARFNGIDFDVVVSDVERGPVSLGNTGSLDVNALMHAVPRLEETGAGRDACEALRMSSQSVHSFSNIVVCSSAVNDELISSLIGAYVRQKSVVLLAVEPKDIDDDAKRELSRALARLREANIPCVSFNDARELEGRDAL